MERYQALLEQIERLVDDRDWHQFHDPKNLAMAVASEAGELVAELRWVPQAEADEWCRRPHNQQRLAEEIADVAITLLMLSERVGVDFLQTIEHKLDKIRKKYPVEQAKGRFE